mgnify:CR=1 FL=1
MDPFKTLKLGNKYSKKELSLILYEPSLKTSREGIFNCIKSKNLVVRILIELSELFKSVENSMIK